MKPLTITARIGKTGPAHKATISFAENLEELVDQFDENIVFQQAKAQIIVGLQGFMRSKATSEKNPITGDALQTEVEKWTPGARAPQGNRVEKLRDRLSKLSDEERAVLRAQLLEMSGQAAAVPQPGDGASQGGQAQPQQAGQAAPSDTRQTRRR